MEGANKMMETPWSSCGLLLFFSCGVCTPFFNVVHAFNMSSELKTSHLNVWSFDPWDAGVHFTLIYLGEIHISYWICADTLRRVSLGTRPVAKSGEGWRWRVHNRTYTIYGPDLFACMKLYEWVFLVVRYIQLAYSNGMRYMIYHTWMIWALNHK